MVNAVLPVSYTHLFKKNRPSPEFFNIRFAFRDSLHIKPQILPTSMVNPIPVSYTHLMFGSADALIRIDMSEYMEKYTVSRMIGARCV